MSLIESIRSKAGKPAPLQVPEVLRKLESAEAELAELQRSHGDAALDALAGDAAATKQLDDLNAKITKARDAVATLKAAHTAAQARDAAHLAAQREALRKTQKAAQRKHLDAVESAVSALSTALAEAVRQYHVALDRAEKAIAAQPLGSIYPDGSQCTPGAIRAQIMAELYRLSAPEDSINGDRLRTFPGASAPDIGYEAQPRAIKPLTDFVHDGVALVIASADRTAD